MRLETFLRANAARCPDKSAIVYGSARISYHQLNDKVTRLARDLARLGLRPTDRIVLYLGNQVEFAELLYAAFSLGAIVVPLTTRLTSGELKHIVEDCSPWGIVFHADQQDIISRVPETLVPNRVSIGGLTDGALSFDQLGSHGTDADLPSIPLEQDDALILYTSGTTGKPKGAITTHRNLITQSYFLNATEWGISSEDVFLATTPLAHRFGFSRLSSAICFGATLAITPKFDPLSAIDAIERNRVSVLAAVPTVCRMLLPHLKRAQPRLASLKTIVTTGEAFPISLKEELRSILPDVGLISFFGQTEAGGVTTLRANEQISHAASVGRPTPGIEVKLTSDDGHTVEIGEVGELLVRSGIPGSWTTMRGYFGRPKETAETIVDGWIRTGDLARQDADGYLYIVDRKKDMVVSGGYNIYSKEVEIALLSDPRVADAAVVGIPDSRFGEAVVAYIEAKPGYVVTPDSILTACRDILAGYKKPKHVFVRHELPRNSQGKILKTILRVEAASAIASAQGTQTSAAYSDQ